MYMYTQGHSRVISCGAFLPEKRVASTELLEAIDSKKRFNVATDWLDRAMGISERRVVDAPMLPSEMAVRAAREALTLADVSASELDAVIYVGVDRDFLLEPATAHVVQHKIGATNAIAFDLSNACHGFMNGIHLMDALIATGQARRGLVVTGERGSRYIDKAIRALRTAKSREDFQKLVGGLTLGDAGAAMLLGPKLRPDTGFIGFMLQSQGQYAMLCTCGAESQESPLETDMSEIVFQNNRLHSAMYKSFMSKLKWYPHDIAKFIHHQVGKNVFRHHAKYSLLPLEKMPNTLQMFGNLVTATIPINIYQIHKNREIKGGDKVFLSGSGSGLAISQAGLVWEAAA